MLKKIEKTMLVLLFLLAGFFATYKLTESPSVWYDEGWYFQSASNLANNGIFGLQLSPGNIVHISMHQTVSYPLIYPLALWFKIFGASILSGRSLMVAFILALLVASYLLSKRLFGSVIAFSVLAMLVSFAPLYGNGKSILGEVPGLLYLILFLLFFNISKSVNDKKILWIMLAGFFAGLCVVTKPFFILLLPAIAVSMFIEGRRGHIHKRDAMAGTLLFIMPIIAWFLIQFQSEESIFKILSYYANPYFYEDSGHAPNMFVVMWQNVKSLFVSLGTLYTMFLLSVWSIAMFIRMRVKEQISTEEIISFLFSSIVMLSFLRIGVIFRYFFPAQIMALIFFPNAISLIIDFFKNKFEFLNKLKYFNQIVFGSTILFFSLFGVYQLSFDSWVAEAYGSHRTEFWQEYFSKVPVATSVFFFDTPEVVPFIKSKNYYQSLLTTRLNTIGKEQLSVLKSGGIDLVIVETTKYNLFKNTMFKNYNQEQIVSSRYSILKLK